jgi:hypothetical protein
LREHHRQQAIKDLNFLTLISFPYYKDESKKSIIHDLQERAQVAPKSKTLNAKFDREAFERMRAMFGGSPKKGGE